MGDTPAGVKRLKLIACDVLFRECCACAARSPHRIDLEFLPKGLHDIGCEGMRARLQEAIDRVPEGDYAAVLLGYALCNNGIAGLRARGAPIVVPRAHDCITLFLGGRARYREVFESCPGAYFRTAGWLERGEAEGLLGQLSMQERCGMNMTREELVERYGEENADFLAEMLGQPLRNYTRVTFIEMGIEPDDAFERRAREEAREHGLSFEKLAGDMGILKRLLDGEWDGDDFLVVAPGQAIAARYDGSIVGIDPGPAEGAAPPGAGGGA